MRPARLLVYFFIAIGGLLLCLWLLASIPAVSPERIRNIGDTGSDWVSSPQAGQVIGLSLLIGVPIAIVLWHIRSRR